MGVTQNITALIDYYGMTQRTFAKRIGKTRSAVSQWLVGWFKSYILRQLRNRRQEDRRGPPR